MNWLRGWTPQVFCWTHLVQMDAGVNSSSGLVALQVGVDSLLTHSHGGIHFSNVLFRWMKCQGWMNQKEHLWSQMESRCTSDSPIKACDSLVAPLSAFQGRHSPPTCNNIQRASPGSDPAGNTEPHSPWEEKTTVQSEKQLVFLLILLSFRYGSVLLFLCVDLF